MRQRCTVCGRDVRFHRVATYRLRQDGREIRRATASRCALVQQWQGLLLDGSMMGRRMTITKVQPPKETIDQWRNDGPATTSSPASIGTGLEARPNAGNSSRDPA